MCKIVYFDQYNEDRRRCCGIRVGDIVRIHYKDNFDFTTEVVGIETFLKDNNICVIWKDGTIRDFSAKNCDIVTKVEDRDRDSVHRLELMINKAFKKLIDTPNWYKKDEFNIFYNHSWVHRRIIIPFKEGTCSIETMVDCLVLSKMQVTDPLKYLWIVPN